MRVGKSPDQGTNGDIIKFPLGNAASAEAFVSQLKSVYEREGLGILVQDTIENPLLSIPPPLLSAHFTHVSTPSISSPDIGGKAISTTANNNNSTTGMNCTPSAPGTTTEITTIPNS